MVWWERWALLTGGIRNNMNAFLLLTLLVAPCLGMRTPYVIGGIEVIKESKYPFMVSIQRGKENICGGAIISNRWVATAAHCVGGKIDFVVTGRLSVTDDNAGSPVYYTPVGYIRHEGYEQDDTIGNPNDIAVIKTAKEIVMSDSAKIIPLAKDGDSFTNCHFMGWGHTESGILPKPKPDRLHEAAVDVFSQEFCKGRWSDKQINENHICAGKDGTAGACSTDGGGPLACDVDGTVTLAGVVSFTAFSCGAGTPTVCSRISKFNTWISDVIAC